MVDACLSRRLDQTQSTLERVNIPAHRQVTRDLWGRASNGMMGTVIKLVVSDTYVLIVEDHIQGQYVL